MNPSLRRIHSNPTLEAGSNRLALEYWRKQPTEDIVHSLQPGQPEALKVTSDGRIMNEIQHRVIGSLMALRKNDLKRYPDDVLVRIILEHPEDLDLQRQLQATCSRLMGQMATTT